MNYFWAKTTADNKPGISVFEHMINVGCVAQHLANARPELLETCGVEAPSLAALAALHDVGKISPGFQLKCEAWLKEKGLVDIARRWNWQSEMELDHGKVTHAALQKHFSENGVDETVATFLPAVLGGHHGRLNRPDERGFRPHKSIAESHSGIDWELERKQTIGSVVSHFGAKLNQLTIEESSPVMWWVGGLTSVADWIGSDERYFSPEREMSPESAFEVANRCLEEIGFVRPQIKEGLSFHDLFHDQDKPAEEFVPNKMQEAAICTITDRGIYVIEAPMGTGKTEAGLWAAYKLLSAGRANGIYFALPTQATSNQMHFRMKTFVERISPGAIEAKIIHSNSWLKDSRTSLSPARTSDRNEEGAEVGRDWFSSAKRALIAPFGVGTVDQALLGIVAAKHFFVRQFALAGKVVILDEIHSYDLYTGTLIDRLIETLEKLGCTVIVLSATLSKARRSEIISGGKSRSAPSAKEPYPLITGRRTGKTVKPVSVAPPKPRSIGVSFTSQTQAISLALDAARQHACVVWVCDTVDSAQQVYLHLKTNAGPNIPIGLLHSRFPFSRREQIEDEWMTRFGKEGSTRCGSILVSTQIVEQSVDIDADLMITELAPTDMLLQRLGRLWRHERGKRRLLKPQLHIIKETKTLNELRKIKPNEIREALGPKALVYSTYVLLRSLEEWKKLRKITLPSNVRKLIEATYKERKNEPKSWQDLLEKAEGEKIAFRQKAEMSSNIWNPALPDEEGVQTRINEIPTLSLVLCRSITETSAEFVNGSKIVVEGEEFHLPTAQAIHRNLVKVPLYSFERNAVETKTWIARYLRGAQAFALVGTDGRVSAKGLKSGVKLQWDLDLGLMIEK